MSEDTVVLQEEIKLVGSQKAVQALEAVGRAASKIGERFSEIGRLAGTVAGIAGVFEIGRSIGEADDLFKSVSRISGATGMAANNAFGMLEAFKLNGIELEGGERIMLSLARNASKMTDSMFEGAAQGQKLAGIMSAMHVKSDAGPEERLMAMAKAAQMGKLGINDMIQAFNIPRSQAMGRRPSTSPARTENEMFCRRFTPPPSTLKPRASKRTGPNAGARRGNRSPNSRPTMSRISTSRRIRQARR